MIALQVMERWKGHVTLKANELVALLISQFLHLSSGVDRNLTAIAPPQTVLGQSRAHTCPNVTILLHRPRLIALWGPQGPAQYPEPQFSPVSLKVAPAGLVVRKKGGPRS